MANRISHDQNFKNLILDYPRDALSFFAAPEAPLPEEKVQITPIRQEQLQQYPGAHYRELDVPLQVDWVDGRRETILFAMEEETELRRFSLHRLAHYCLDLAELNDTDRVVPVVIFLGEAASAPASLTLGTEYQRYLTFDYLSCNLKDIPYERWQHSDNLVARLNLPNMRYPAGQKLEVCSQAYDSLLALEQDSDRRAKYLQFIDFYAGLNDNELNQMQLKYLKDKPNMAGFFYAGLNDNELNQMQLKYLKDKPNMAGFAQHFSFVVQHFRQEGLQEGERTVLERLLQRRFGTLSPEITEKLSVASSVDLENWAENVLDAKTLDEVFGSNH